MCCHYRCPKRAFIHSSLSVLSFPQIKVSEVSCLSVYWDGRRHRDTGLLQPCSSTNNAHAWTETDLEFLFTLTVQDDPSHSLQISVHLHTSMDMVHWVRLLCKDVSSPLTPPSAFTKQQTSVTIKTRRDGKENHEVWSKLKSGSTKLPHVAWHFFMKFDDVRVNINQWLQHEWSHDLY